MLPEAIQSRYFIAASAFLLDFGIMTYIALGAYAGLANLPSEFLNASIGVITAPG
ncbi:hypothetical protein D3C76_1774310 [compost metagenome]